AYSACLFFSPCLKAPNVGWCVYSVVSADEFVSTRWSIVLAAGDSELPSSRAWEALSELCRIYWRPLYLFLRREGVGPEVVAPEQGRTQLRHIRPVLLAVARRCFRHPE